MTEDSRRHKNDYQRFCLETDRPIERNILNPWRPKLLVMGYRAEKLGVCRPRERGANFIAERVGTIIRGSNNNNGVASMLQPV